MNTNGIPTQAREGLIKEFQTMFDSGLKAKKMFLDICKNDGRVLISRTETNNVVLKIIYENDIYRFCIAGNNSLKSRITCIPVEDTEGFEIEENSKKTLTFSFKIYGLEYIVALLF